MRFHPQRFLGWAFDWLTAIRARRRPDLPTLPTLLADDLCRTRPPKALRLTERLRDKLRPMWLRLRK